MGLEDGIGLDPTQPVTPTEGTTNPEDTERERKTPAFISYRNNTMYEQYGQDILRAVQTDGRPTESHIFTADTDYDAIAEWIKANPESVSAKVYVVDGTVESKLSSLQIGGIRIGLDQIMQKAAVESIFGRTAYCDFDRDPRNSDVRVIPNEELSSTTMSERFRRQKEAFVALLEKAPEEKKKLDVYIVKGITKGAAATNIATHEGYYDDKGRYVTNEACKAYAQMLEEAFHESGFGTVKVIEDFEDIPDDALAMIIKGDALVVFNRHSHCNQEMEDVALTTPLESFYEDAVDKLGIEGDHSVMTASIERQIAEQLATKIDEK